MRDSFQIITRKFGLLNKTCCSIDGVEVSVLQSHTLYEIKKSGSPSIQQLAVILGIDITTFSRQVQTLHKMGLIEKKLSPEDKRVTILELTKLGHEIAEKINIQVENDLETIFSKMTEFERETVEKSIKHLAQVMNETNLTSQNC